MIYDRELVGEVEETLIRAASSLSSDHKDLYEKVIARESQASAKWALEMILKNAEIAETNRSPLCDDTGVPHLVLDLGHEASVSGLLLDSIQEGVRQGLRKLPGRPMAIKGDHGQRIDQSMGVDEDPAALEAAPLLLRRVPGRGRRLHILMFGGGPAIRGKTYRIFHKQSVEQVLDEIVAWATEGTSLLGCTPSTLAIGVGRSQYEASAMMLEALVDGSFSQQSQMERYITQKVNEAKTGPLGLGGDTTVLATFMKVGPQRASGVRIVSFRPACCYEPRKAHVDL